MIEGRRAARALALGCALLAARAHGAPGVTEALRTADALLATGNVAAAEAVLEEVVAAAPTDPAPYNQRAILLARRGELERARDLLDAALRTDPAYAEVYANLQAVLGALAARAYARALDDTEAPATTLELASIVPSTGAEASRGPIPAVVTRVPAVPAPASRSPEPATAPAPKPAIASAAVSEPAHAAETARIRDRVHAWAKAWSAQDVDAYLSFYSDRFRPGRGVSRKAWRVQRRTRVGRPAFIEVDVDDIEVELDGADRARARFEQTYRSNRLESTVEKTLDLALDDGEWRIVRERVR